MKKVMTIVGTRPEIIRLSEVIKKCDLYFNHVLVHTGQNYDYSLNEVFFENLSLRKPDYYLDCAKGNLGQMIGNIISKSYDILLKEAPQALLILGDTNSALSSLAAKRLKIPIFHMEAGNRCFDQNVPEEINRRLVDHLSDINLTYTEHSRRYLISEGIRKEHIFVTGSPMNEVIQKNYDNICSSTVLNKLNLEASKYILVSAHREENLDIDENFTNFVNSLNKIALKFNMPIIYSTHPRSLKKIKKKSIVFNDLIKNLEPFGFFDYNKLQQNAYCVLSDSGTLSEESSMLKFPAVLIRNSTERPEVLDKGSIVIGGLEPNEIIESIIMARKFYESDNSFILPSDYVDTNVSEKVVKIIQSYTKIINKVVWNK